MHRYNDWDGGPGVLGWLVMAVLMVAFWGGLAWVIVSLFRHNATAHHMTGSGHVITPATPGKGPEAKGPEDVLHDRLARGDIDVEEYHARIDALRKKRPD